MRLAVMTEGAGLTLEGFRAGGQTSPWALTLRLSRGIFASFWPVLFPVESGESELSFWPLNKWPVSSDSGHIPGARVDVL